MTFIGMHHCIQSQVHPPILTGVWKKKLLGCFCSNKIDARWIAFLSSLCCLLLLLLRRGIKMNCLQFKLLLGWIAVEKLHIPAIKALLWLKCCNLHWKFNVPFFSSSYQFFSSLLFDYLHFSTKRDFSFLYNQGKNQQQFF